MTEDELNQIIAEDVASAIELVRSEPGPIVWLTGNNFMPPLRAWGQAEKVWQADENDEMFGGTFYTDRWSIWEQYSDEFEQRLMSADIYLDQPDYDNALYAVDLTRWAYVGDSDMETLEDEWHAI